MAGGGHQRPLGGGAGQWRGRCGARLGRPRRDAAL